MEFRAVTCLLSALLYTMSSFCHGWFLKPAEHKAHCVNVTAGPSALPGHSYVTLLVLLGLTQFLAIRFYHYLIWHTRWNDSEILLIYLTYPSGKEPVFIKGEGKL